MDDKLNKKFPYFDDSISYFNIDDINNIEDINNEEEEDLMIDIEKWKNQLELLNKLLDDDDDDDIIFSIPKD